MNPGQYHEVNPGQVDVESVKVDFQHRSKDRWVAKGIIGQLIDLQRHSLSTALLKILIKHLIHTDR